MMLRILTIAALSILPLMVQAQCSAADVTTWLPAADQAALQARVENTAYGQGVYWQAEKQGTSMAIIGTMHLPDPRHAALLSRVQNRLDRSDLVLVEATLDDQSDMQRHMANTPDLIAITTGPTLPELLDDATWAALRDTAKARGLPAFIAAKMQPWFLALTLSVPPCAMTAMTSGEQGLDGLIMEHALARNIPLTPLEPWENMLALLSSGTQAEQLDALRMSAIPADVQDAILSTVVNAYFEGNMALGWHLSFFLGDYAPNVPPEVYDAQMAEMEQQLLVDRNRAWMPVIETAARTYDNVFIAFGAAHLIGENGILRLLENTGWTITPL